MKNRKHIWNRLSKKRFLKSLSRLQKRAKKRKGPKPPRSFSSYDALTRKNYTVRITLPRVFSFEKNREGVLFVINRIENVLDGKKSIFIHLDRIKEMDLDAIVLLLGIMAEFKSERINFNGSHPNDPKIRKIWKKSGFLELLVRNNYSDDDISFGDHEGIYTHGRNAVDQVQVGNLISNSLECVYGEPRRNQGVQTLLMEAMKNTITHADPKGTESRHWWLSIKQQKDEAKLKVSFLDYGVGIFKSLNSKTEEDGGYSVFSKWLNLGFRNTKILKEIMNGQLTHVSRTRMPQHGTGLPGMKSALDNNYISKLVIMSNDVYAQVNEDEYKLLESNFSGTFIQFEVVKECISKTI